MGDRSTCFCWTQEGLGSDPVEVVLNDLGPVALPPIGKKEGFYYNELYPHCGCDPTRDPWSLSFSPTTDSDLAFGADPFGDGAASEDLPQPESQPDSEGELCYCELYPHCGCDPAKDRVALLDTPFAILE